MQTTVELGRRPDTSFQFDYRAELVHPKLPDCRATFHGQVRWPQARPDLLGEWLDGAKERLKERAEQLTDEPVKAEVEAARDIADLVGRLVQTTEGRDQWAKSKLDDLVLPQFERTLARLRDALPLSRSTALAESYADTVDAALGFVQAARNAPTDAAEQLITQIEDDVGTHPDLATEQLHTRLTELRDEPDANPEFVERVHTLLQNWPER